ncbi:polysaccharide pyruvyl transferase family protein [Nostoc sp. CENA67]|uniref:Polysaccharide pyruvyl transferase family protein n=1 Tax=Amazonocrinis nigriterrae CENA67 TaxID=2794033 RepID=A0A8J7LC96_9NOST|nr:polysaccharide pyruvyl transferase family protein [Amazonocrinis nigriterrae]MBH8566266.1 polysaccharide pyruvyl transferase family protein [Amazonocrinis nigriterrae CENA67]
MKLITILDTAACSSNIGDQIIMDAVNRNLNDLFPDAFFLRTHTHDVISKTSYRYIQTSEFVIVGGTNLLSSNMNSYNQWKVSLWDSLFVKDIILMGVGWWQYQKKPNSYTNILYNRLLNKNYFHSVRDGYSEQNLKSIGITNVINTSCPTMWSLTEDHCTKIPTKKSNAVLVTFTEYNQKLDYDTKLINILSQEYEKIYFWTQQPKDYEYTRSICGDSVVYLKPNLKALDEILSSGHIDYVGTRLHAGVRALQHQRRTLILSVDNRAVEIAKDTNLPTVKREDIESISSWINSSYETRIKLPLDNINEWKNQFRE